jgi:hypothetical protein
MPRERILSDERYDFAVDPEWKPKDSAEPVRIINVSDAPESAQVVKVRPYVDVYWSNGELGGGVQLLAGAILAPCSDSPGLVHGTLEVDLSTVGSLVANLGWKTGNSLIKTLRRARDADNGKPE